jgi:hypothetical protein
LGQPQVITLTLNQPSEFGTKIVFVPKSLVFAALRSHPKFRKSKLQSNVGYAPIDEVLTYIPTKSKKKPSRIWVREGLLWVDVLADYCLS